MFKRKQNGSQSPSILCTFSSEVEDVAMEMDALSELSVDTSTADLGDERGEFSSTICTVLTS